MEWGPSPDGDTLYVADPAAGRILALSIAPDGSLGPRRDFIRLRDTIPDAKPDSFKIDGHGEICSSLSMTQEGTGNSIACRKAHQRLCGNLAGDFPPTNVAISPDGASLYVAAIDDDPAITSSRKIVQWPNPIAPGRSGR